MFCAPVAVAPIWLPSPAASSSRACPIGKPRAIPPPRGPLIAVGVAVSARVLRRAADTDSASSQRLVENLQRQVARLQEANSQLQAEVLAAKAGLGVPTEDAEQARSSFDETGQLQKAQPGFAQHVGSYGACQDDSHFQRRIFLFRWSHFGWYLQSEVWSTERKRAIGYRFSGLMCLESMVAAGLSLYMIRNAAPYIAAFRGGTVVVHLPSFMLEDDMQETFRGLMEERSL
eukprot:s2572_g8.t1